MTKKNLIEYIQTFKKYYLLPAFCLSLFFFKASRVYAGDTLTVFYLLSNSTYQFAAGEMKKNMEAAGYTVNFENIANLANTVVKKRIIITVRGTPEANNFLSLPGILPLPPATPEGYSIRKKTVTSGIECYVIGADKNGALYGAQDLSRFIQFNGLQPVRALDKKPYIVNRGIKFNIPLDARTPGYSDNGDAAQNNIAVMWDINFWHELLDDMAGSRFNMLSLWSLAPFPSMVNVPEYPNADINDVKKTTFPLSGFKTLTGTNMSNKNVLDNLVTLKTITISEKIKFWQNVMQYASDRGISCYLFTWNTFTFGTEKSGYGFTTAVDDLKTKDYFRKATRALISTYPLLKGIGITAGENLNGEEDDKEDFLFNAYGKGINDALKADTSRTFQLIHRAHQANIKVIKSAFSNLHPRCNLAFSYKYSQAHIYSSTAPDYIYKSNFLKNIGSSRFFLTLRDDDWYYLRGGSDPDFAREYIKNIPLTNLGGFYLGPDGYTWGREYVSINNDSPNKSVFDKRWYSFSIWGALGYDPDIPDSLFTNMLKTRFTNVNAQSLYDAWALASRVVPLVNTFHNEGCTSDYQWYPEACFSNNGFHDVNRFISADPQSNEGIMSIPSYTTTIINNGAITGITPLQVAKNLQTTSDAALALIAGIAGTDKELNQTISDISAMAYLGQYYSKKIQGATNKNIADNVTDSATKRKYKNYAISNLRDAAECWRNYASQISYAYVPQWLTRMQQMVDVKKIQLQVDNDILLAGGTISRVEVSSVSISPVSATIPVDSALQMTALPHPANVTNKNIRWSSDNNAIATVNANGLVKGEAVGIALITATSLDGGKTASCTVTVTDSSNVVKVPGSWVTGTTHPKETGFNAALVVFIYGEDTSAVSVSSVSYGGKAMTPIIQKSISTTATSYTGAFILDEAGIAAATGATILVNWAKTPANGSTVISGFFSNVDQLTMIEDTASDGSFNATTISTAPLTNVPGDAVFLAATAAKYSDDYILNNKFIRGTSEQNPSWGDVVVGYKTAKGISEIPSVTMIDSSRQTIIGFVLSAKKRNKPASRKNGGELYAPGAIQIYPNPVINKTLTVDFHRSVKSGLIQLFDLSGKLIMKKMVNNQTKLNLDMSNLARGIYLLNIYTNKEWPLSKKVVVP